MMKLFKSKKDKQLNQLAVQQNAQFKKSLPSLTLKGISKTQIIVRSSLLVLSIFWILISIQFGAGLFNYSVLNNFLYVDFGSFNKVGDVFFNNHNILYWLSGWGRDNMFGFMWFGIWSGITLSLLLGTFTNAKPVWLLAFFGVWFFLWVMVAYPFTRIIRNIESSTGSYITTIASLVAVVIGLIIAPFIPLVGGFVSLAAIIALIVGTFTGDISWLVVGMLVWALVSLIAGAVGIFFGGAALYKAYKD